MSRPLTESLILAPLRLGLTEQTERLIKELQEALGQCEEWQILKDRNVRETSGSLAAGDCKCFKCGRVGWMIDEFLSPRNGRCAECQDKSENLGEHKVNGTTELVETGGRKAPKITLQEIVAIASKLAERSAILMAESFEKQLGPEKDWTQATKEEVQQHLTNRVLLVTDCFLTGVEVAYQMMLSDPEGSELIWEDDYDHEEKLKKILKDLEDQGLIRS